MDMTKPVKCKHCSAINHHYSFQCALIRKPIQSKEPKVKEMTWEQYQAKKKSKAKDKPKPIKKISDKQKKINTAYTALRKVFMQTNSICQAKLYGCFGNATDVHHKFSGKDRSKYFLHTDTWVSVCRNCHHLIHDYLSTEELIKLNLRCIE